MNFGGTPKDRFAYACLVAFLLAFLCYVGAQQAHRPSTPLKVEEDSPHRQTVAPSNPENKTLESPKVVVVHVVGAVNKPGVYTLDSGKRVIDAVKMAGGFDNANEQGTNLAAHLIDGEQIVIPLRGQESAEGANLSPAQPASSVTGTKGKSSAGPVSLNNATAEQLETIPGIGPATAAKILSYRTEHGGFQSVDELTSVGGIGAKKLEKMRPFLTP